MDLIKRPRRLRKSAVLRGLVQETRLSAHDFIYPLFVVEGTGIKREIPSMPGVYHFSLDKLGEELETIQKSGIPGVLFFGVPDHKDEEGSGAWASDGIVQKALRLAKSGFPKLLMVADVCLCEYTSHGHCGVIHNGEVQNDASVELIARTAVSLAEAGADVVAPSDMMDGRVGAIRTALDAAGLQDTIIMSYSVKYASSFYGPFRDAAGSTPAFGDRKAYQMDYHNRREAIREAVADVEEGADIIMVKPALSYLDIIADVSKLADVPVAAYQVSGEYAMIKAAAQMGWIQEKGVVMETITAIKRAGAKIIITYFAKQLAAWLKEEN